MQLIDVIPLIDLGGTTIFAVLVYIELRGMRKESFALMQKIAGFIHAYTKE